jgi:hypothetical protein
MLTKMKESKCTKTKLIKAYDLFYIVYKVGTTTTLCKTCKTYKLLKLWTAVHGVLMFLFFKFNCLLNILALAIFA